MLKILFHYTITIFIINFIINRKKVSLDFQYIYKAKALYMEFLKLQVISKTP
jgi:hypothetical protein